MTVPVHPKSNKAVTVNFSPFVLATIPSTSKEFSNRFLCVNHGFSCNSCSTNWASLLANFFSCCTNWEFTCSIHDSCMKDLMCLIARLSSFWSTTFLIHWHVHGSMVFDQVFELLVRVSTLSGRIFPWTPLCSGSNLLNRTSLCLFSHSSPLSSFTPVDPNPFSPHWVLSNSFTSFMSAKLILSNTNWAILSPFLMSNFTSEWFISKILTSPQ